MGYLRGDTMKKTTIQEIKKRVGAIPQLSDSAVRIMKLVGNEDGSIQDICKIVECDGALTAQLFKVVNSASMGLKQEIKSITHAVNYLGARRVASIALNLSSGQLYSKPLAGYETEKGELWNHCLQSAIAAREIAKFAKKGALNADVAYTGGLLHDIGKAVLSEYLKGTAEKIQDQIYFKNVKDYLDAETQMVGTNHCEVGECLADHWKLPDDFRYVIQYHHMPSQAPAEFKTLVYAVHMADFVSMMTGSTTSSDTLQYHLDEQYNDYFDLNSESLQQVIVTMTFEFKKLQEVFDSGA
jgi:putative nucleotidyltransferase with HDIG domain